MGIYKVADGAYFVPSYSIQTIAPGFENATTIQSLSGFESDEYDNDVHQHLDDKDAKKVIR